MQGARFFATSAFWTGIAKIVGAGLTFVLHSYFAQRLGEEGYGFYAYTLTVLTVLELVASCGSSASSSKFIPIYRDNRASLKGFLNWSSGCSLVVSVILAGGLISAIAWRDGLNINTMTVGIAALFPFVYLKLFAFQIRALGHSALTELLVTVLRPGLILLCYYLVHKEETVKTVDVLVIEFAVLAFLAILALVLRKRILGPISEDASYEPQEWFKTGLSLGLLMGAAAITNYTDIIVVKWLLGEFKVAHYNAILKITALVNLGFLAANAVAAPLISQYYEKRSKEDLNRLVQFVALGFFVPTLIAGLGATLIGPFLLGFWGESYQENSQLLAYVCLLQIFIAGFGPCGFLLTMTGRENFALYVLCAAGALNFGLNVLLIPKYKLYGAALATGLTQIFWKGTMYLKVRKDLGIDSSVLNSLGLTKELINKLRR